MGRIWAKGPQGEQEESALPVTCSPEGGQLGTRRYAGCAPGRRSLWGGLPQITLGSPGNNSDLGGHFKARHPLQVRGGSLPGLVVSAAGRAFRPGVHPVPGLTALRGPARL